jgi:hypothetical protein
MTGSYLSNSIQKNQNQSDEEKLIQNHILRLRDTLDKKLTIDSFTTLSDEGEALVLPISYAGNSFVRIAKNQLIAVIIGGLLLLSASKLLYEK